LSATFDDAHHGSFALNSSLWCLGGVRTTKPSKRTTKLILIQDFEQLGNRGDEVQVRPGYARNYLIPSQIAVYNIPENKNKFVVEKSEEEARKIAEAKKKAAMRRRLERLSLTIKRHVTGETMYGSVSAKDIAKLLNQNGVEVQDGDVRMGKALKELGSHSVLVRISGEEIEVPFTVVKR